MALVSLVETSVQSGNTSDITYIIPYYLKSDSGPTTFTRIDKLSDLKNIFYPSVTSPNYFLAEYLANLGYTLLVRRLDDSENYTSLRFFEAHTSSYHEDEPEYSPEDYTLKEVSYWTTDKNGNRVLATYEIRSLKPIYKEPAITTDYPQFTACPQKDMDYEQSGICYIGTYTSRLVNSSGNRVLLNYGVDLQIDFTKLKALSYLLINRVSPDFPEGVMQLIVFVDDSVPRDSEGKPEIDAYGDLGISSVLLDTNSSETYATVDLPTEWTEEATEGFLSDLFNALRNLGYVIESYELDTDDGETIKGIKNLLISSAVPIGLATLSMFGLGTNEFMPLTSNDAYYQDTICAGFDEHKILDFYSKYPKSTGTISITITKLLSDEYNFRVTNTINSYIHEEFFQVDYDPNSDTYIEKALSNSDIITVKVYKSGIPIEPGTYTLGRVPDPKPIEDYDEETSLRIINSGIGDINSFNFIVDCNLPLSLQQAIYDRFESSIALKLFEQKTETVDTKRTVSTAYFYPSLEIDGVEYPGYVAFFQKFMDDGQYCGEIDFVDRLIYPDFDKPESKFIAEITYDNYRYLLENFYIYREDNRIPPETVVFNSLFVNYYLPQVDLFLTQTNIQNEITRIFNSLDFSKTKIDSVELIELTKSSRTLTIDYGINYNVNYMDTINLSLTINI